MERYIVLVDKDSTAKPEQQEHGFLANFGVIQVYTRSQALKRAEAFKGKILAVWMSI